MFHLCIIEAGFINPFKDKIVVIGTSLAEDQDIKPTPYLTYGDKDVLTPGLEIHANAIQQMLHSNYINLPFGGLEYSNNVSKYNLEKKKFTFFAPQRLGLEKGYDLIWNAIKLCKSDFDFIQVKWFVESNRGGTAVTNTDKLSKITKDLYENAPPQVKFIPLIDHKDLGRYFVAADAIMGQMQSGIQGGIEREAVFCKKPVLSYNDPNKKTILDGKEIQSTFSPKSKDPNELAKLIDKILSGRRK